MSYLVLARKYRPQTFEDLVGQDHVARTLANAIATGRIAHAFLFTGVRGVGKTTSARLLAKCLSCVGPDGKATGPTATPCNQCAPCTEITAGQDLDVQEIDGASYNGVDEVRRLQEGMTFRPARDRFKIYIVDEVHMLSTAAWNAFLKTLEEPPPHVKFIFATTEVHKVPVTILSRCQRYDFKLIRTQAIAKRLEEVLALEKITTDGSAVQVLAREAAGSMRDAMSLLDQVIAFSGTNLTGEDVARVLGVADRRILHDLATALVSGDAPACLGVVERLAQQGFDLDARDEGRAQAPAKPGRGEGVLGKAIAATGLLSESCSIWPTRRRGTCWSSRGGPRRTTSRASSRASRARSTTSCAAASRGWRSRWRSCAWPVARPSCRSTSFSRASAISSGDWVERPLRAPPLAVVGEAAVAGVSTPPMRPSSRRR